MSYQIRTLEGLASVLHCQQVKKTAKGITCTCPWARFTHEGGQDRNPSFKINTRGYAKCYACNKDMKLSDMVLDLLVCYQQEKLAFPLEEVQNLVANESMIALLDQPEWGMNTCSIEWPDGYLEEYPPIAYLKDNIFHAQGTMYMACRKVSLLVMDALDVRFDEQYKRVCFPIRDWQGRLMGMRGRAIQGEPKHYSYEYQGKRNEFIWGNEHTCSLFKPILLVEGHFDLASVYLFYQNTLVAMSVSITPEKLKRLDSAVSIHTLFDPGEGGDTGRELVWETFKGKIPVKHHYLKTGDPNEVPQQELVEALGSLI